MLIWCVPLSRQIIYIICIYCYYYYHYYYTGYCGMKQDVTPKCIFLNENLHLRVWRLSQRYGWGCISSGMWHCAAWWSFSDVSKSSLSKREKQISKWRGVLFQKHSVVNTVNFIVGNLFKYILPKPALEAIQPPTDGLPGAFFPEENRSDRETDNEPQSSAEFKRLCVYGVVNPAYAFFRPTETFLSVARKQDTEYPSRQSEHGTIRRHCVSQFMKNENKYGNKSENENQTLPFCQRTVADGF